MASSGPALDTLQAMRYHNDVQDDTALTLRLPRRLLDALGSLADHYGVSRAAMVRVLIVEAAEPRGLLAPLNTAAEQRIPPSPVAEQSASRPG